MSNDVTRTLDVYDTEVSRIGILIAELQSKSYGMSTESWERMAHDRFADEGFLIEIKWFDTNLDQVYSPQIEIVGRIDPDFVFDRDRQAHEVVRNVLQIPGEDAGVIKTDPSELARLYDEGKKHKC